MSRCKCPMCAFVRQPGADDAAYMRECEAVNIARKAEGRNGEWLHEFWRIAVDKRGEQVVAVLRDRVEAIRAEHRAGLSDGAEEVARRLGVA